MHYLDDDLTFESFQNAPTDDAGEITLPVVRLEDEVILPHAIIPLPISPDDFALAEVVENAQRTRTTIGVISEVTINAENALSSQLPFIATETVMIDIASSSGKTHFVMIQGRRRIEIASLEKDGDNLIAHARVIEDILPEDEPAITQLNAIRSTCLMLLNDIADLNEAISDELLDHVHTLDDYGELADTIASLIPLSNADKNTLLETASVQARLEQLKDALLHELRGLEIRDDVQTQVQDEFSRAQREVYLREQMRIIQQELGDSDFEDNDVEVLRQRLHEAQLPAEAHKQAFKELSRLAMMTPISPEAGVIRTYLDWLLDIPWHITSKDNLNLRHAQKVLDREHYGLEKVKERIIEHIAVRKLAGDNMKSPILCFVGPPGVGKTSLGKSIAEALGREFVRVSLGGVRDEAEIRGHRRTYIGAMPGRFIQTIKRAGTTNPVFMLDEIDKMSEDYNGDPAAALLEVLDPEQNNAFADHYLDVPYDLSKVMFIATANELYPLPEALEDRMEIIEFRAYTEEEKLEIARRFLIPKQLKAHGISRRGITFQTTALQHIIQHYTLEAGVRNLERAIADVCRKITKRVALRQKYPKRITPSRIEDYLGPPLLIDTHLNKEDSIGLATGLVWTSGGGDIQLIEASLLLGKGSFTLTGSLGDVLQESAQIAWQYMRAIADKIDVPHDDFDNYDVHLHLPEGSVPKDGPSAGITLATVIISVFTERKIRNNWAMTGEMTLRGHVLPVGGIKEKVLGARRRGIKNIILPADNKKDLVDIPKSALRDLNIELVKHIDEVIDLVLMPPPTERQRDLDAESLGEDDTINDN
ncbi:MAG: endopeptidase La [Chloroflexota bacterium]